MATLDPKTRKKFAAAIRVEANDCDGDDHFLATFAGDAEDSWYRHWNITADDVPAANALLCKWRMSFRKWVKENIR